MAENKTKANEQSVEDFLNALPDERKRKDSFAIIELMKQVTGLEPTMWGSSIVGFGTYHYKYESGREGDNLIVGFAPRKQNLALYNLSGADQYDTLREKLGKHSMGGGCLYIKRLHDVDMGTLKQMIKAGFQHMKQEHNLE
jgi:hypothetical protein